MNFAVEYSAHTRRLIAKMRQWLQEVFDAINRARGRADLTRQGFREWLAGATQEQTNRTALAYATRQQPKVDFATSKNSISEEEWRIWAEYPYDIRDASEGEDIMGRVGYPSSSDGGKLTAEDIQQRKTIAAKIAKAASGFNGFRELWRGVSFPNKTEALSAFPHKKVVSTKGLRSASVDKNIAATYATGQLEWEENAYPVLLRIGTSNPNGLRGIEARPFGNDLPAGLGGEVIMPPMEKFRVNSKYVDPETGMLVVNLYSTGNKGEPTVDFATSKNDGLFDENTAGDADRTTTGDYLAAADKFRNETTEVPKGSPLDNRQVRQLAPYLISGNKGDIVGAHGAFIAKLAQGAKRVVDAFGGAAIYSHFLADRGLLPAGSQWNEWEYTRSITNRQIANNTEAVITALDQVKADYLAAFPRENLPATRDEMLDLRRRQLDWMQQRIADLVPNPAKDAEGRLILPDSPQMAAFYLFAQNHMAENRVVDIELRNGRATFTTGGKVNGKDDFKFIAENSKTGKPEWNKPPRIWDSESNDRIKTAAARLRQLEVLQGDGWSLAANAEPGSLVFVDSSYFQSDKDIAEGKQVMNYGTGTLDDGNWPDWLVKFREKLEPHGNDVRYVVTNNFNNQVVAELEKAGWTILRTSRTNKTGIAHELVALSPAAAKAGAIQPQPERTAPAASLGIRGSLRPVRPSGGRPTVDSTGDLALSNDSRESRAAELKANLPEGVTTAAKLEKEQEEQAQSLSEAAKAQRHPAAVGDVPAGDAWMAVPKMTEAQLAEEQTKIAEYFNETFTDLTDIKKVSLHARLDALKAEQARRAAPAPTMTLLAKPDPKSALVSEWKRGKAMREEGIQTGNDIAREEGQRIMNSAKRRLDADHEGWQDEVYGSADPKIPAQAATGETKPAPNNPPSKTLPARAGQIAEDDGRNLAPPTPPNPPENGPARPDDAAPERGRTRAAFGHSSYTPTFLDRRIEQLRSILVGFRGAIPELPAFPALAAKSDRFIREHGPTFYNNLKAFYRTLNSANDYIQRTAEEQVDAVTGPLMKTDVPFDAAAFAKLKKRQEQARRLKAAGKPMPAGAAAELDALQSRLEAHPYVLFNKLIYFMDMDWRSRNLKDSAGNPIKLPDGINQTEIDNELTRLSNLIAASPHSRAIESAFERHKTLVAQVAEDIKNRDLLAAEHLTNPYYFPHLTLQITRGDKTIERELRPEHVKVDNNADFRGYLQDPVGSTKPIESDYIRALYYHLVQVGAHNLKADAIRDYARPYDVMEQVKNRAAALSKKEGRSVSWEEVYHREFEKNGYVLHGTDSRDAFPTVMVDRDKLARRLGLTTLLQYPSVTLPEHRHPFSSRAPSRACGCVAWLLIAITCSLLWLAQDPESHAWLHRHTVQATHGHEACCPHEHTPQPAGCDDPACAIHLFANDGLLLVTHVVFAGHLLLVIYRSILHSSAPFLKARIAPQAPSCGPPSVHLIA